MFDGQSDDRRIRPDAPGRSLEALLNPFGDPWKRRRRKNRSIPLATSSLLGVFGREPWCGYHRFPLSPEYATYLRNASSPWHYDETVGRLADDMPAFRAAKSAFQAAGIDKRWIGYTVLNFADSAVTPGVREAPEAFFLHEPGRPQTRENRLAFRHGGQLRAGGPVFDVRNPALADYMAEKLVSAMVRNDLDAVLIDYASRHYAFGKPQLNDKLPADWSETFEANQYRLLKIVSYRAAKHGKLVFCNGVMLDGLWATPPAKARLYLKACHGSFWEQPFRPDWRDNPPAGRRFYESLEPYFALADELGKPIIVKQGTYQWHGDETVVQGWNARFAKTDAARERELARYLLASYLLFTRGKNTPLIYTHPTEVSDIFASEAWFDEFGLDVGAPRGERVEVRADVHVRRFAKAVAVVNDSEEPFRIGDQEVPARSGRVVDTWAPRRLAAAARRRLGLATT